MNLQLIHAFLEKKKFSEVFFIFSGTYLKKYYLDLEHCTFSELN